MCRENLHPVKSPTESVISDHLESTGLAVEYFPAFEQAQHDFHTHAFIELLFVIKGTFRHVTADRTYDETAGGLTILNYHQFHTLKTPAGPVELMNIYWNLRKYPYPKLPPPLSSRLPELIPPHPMLGHRLNKVVHLQFDDSDRIPDILFMLHNEQQHPSDGSEAAIQALFRLFLIRLCRVAPVVLYGNRERINPRMEAVRRHLDEHFSESIRLEKLWEMTRLKKANLCRQFKAYTGLSTGSYLKQRRLAAAMLKLRTTHDKILTICHECGFSDAAHFNRVFRGALDQTPSAYRAATQPTKDKRPG
jgi:AraC-like DNA-binding protein